MNALGLVNIASCMFFDSVPPWMTFYDRRNGLMDGLQDTNYLSEISIQASSESYQLLLLTVSQCAIFRSLKL